MKIKVYIAGPYSNGDVAINVRNAIEVGNEIHNLGFSPYIPHFTHFWHMLFPKAYEKWLEHDNEWIHSCDCLLRLPGQSGGADKEVELAKSWGLKVFYSIEDLCQAYPTRNK